MDARQVIQILTNILYTHNLLYKVLEEIKSLDTDQ